MPIKIKYNLNIFVFFFDKLSNFRHFFNLPISEFFGSFFLNFGEQAHVYILCIACQELGTKYRYTIISRKRQILGDDKIGQESALSLSDGA